MILLTKLQENETLFKKNNNKIHIDNDNLTNQNLKTIILNYLKDFEFEKIKDLPIFPMIYVLIDLQNSLNNESLSTVIIDEDTSISKLKIKEILLDIAHKIDENLKNMNLKFITAKLNIETLQQNFRTMEIPKEIAIESLEPLYNFLENLEKNLEKLNKAKSDIMKYI